MKFMLLILTVFLLGCAVTPKKKDKEEGKKKVKIHRHLHYDMLDLRGGDRR